MFEEFGTQYLISIVLVTLRVSLTAVGVATLISIVLAGVLGFREFPGKRAAVAVVNTGMGFPSVVVGLAVLLLLSNQGPIGGGFTLGIPGTTVAFDFGGVELLFTPTAMIISQVILATPVVTSVTLSAIEGVDDSIRDAAFAAGGTGVDVSVAVVREARYGVVTAVLAGFGRAVSEVGSVLIVGGNIAIATGGGARVSFTRTLTTAITVESRQGNYELGIALGVVLLVLALAVNALGSLVRDRGNTR
ncbi:ABC transporter permease subunit [Halomarina oriensis]|uniref:ABC transporter permease subunit n=1 Tax=Halomarina oriensis TaxID=671145 RepID=A0A6B0GLC7_9EURY|nr:ABC transporter permease subunit [Halomarina oriensis]